MTNQSKDGKKSKFFQSPAIFKYVTYKGRISRKQFALYHLYTFVFCITLLDIEISIDRSCLPDALAINMAIFVAISMLFWMRRGHDLNWPATFVVALVAANLVGSLLLGPASVLTHAVTFITFGFFLILIFKKGTPGPNRFGPDPVAIAEQKKKERKEYFMNLRKERQEAKDKAKREAERQAKWKETIEGAPIECEPVENRPVDEETVREYTEVLKKEDLEKAQRQAQQASPETRDQNQDKEHTGE
jgi:uncharacterized membrane protein YhaH (DUF805 family)